MDVLLVEVCRRKPMLTASWDKTARLWDIATGAELRVFRGHTDILFDVAFAPDGKQILTSSLDTTARLWDVATGKEVRRQTPLTYNL